MQTNSRTPGDTAPGDTTTGDERQRVSAIPEPTGVVPAAIYPRASVARKQRGPAGIGGWLILPVLGLVATLIRTPIGLAESSWDDLIDIFVGELPELDTLWSLLGDVLLIGGSAFALVLIFKRSPRVPKIMTVLYVATIVLAVGDAIADGAASPASVATDRDVIGAIIRAAIWIPYFHYSRRVANTFQEATLNERIDGVF